MCFTMPVLEHMPVSEHILVLEQKNRVTWEKTDKIFTYQLQNSIAVKIA